MIEVDCIHHGADPVTGGTCFAKSHGNHPECVEAAIRYQSNRALNRIRVMKLKGQITHPEWARLFRLILRIRATCTCGPKGPCYNHR